MSTKDKLIRKLLSKPTDFTYDELKAVLSYFGYTLDESGSGSRVSFYNETTKSVIKIHKPHPGNILKGYVIKDVIDKLKEDGCI